MNCNWSRLAQQEKGTRTGVAANDRECVGADYEKADCVQTKIKAIKDKLHCTALVAYVGRGGNDERKLVRFDCL